jgi:hypothetical protein
MIANLEKGRGFRGALNYNFKNASHLLFTNFAGKNAREMAAETKIARQLRPNLKNAVTHVSLSASPDDPHLTDKQWIEIAERYLLGMGYDLEKNQFAIFRHTDKPHEHIHIVANRINCLTGEVVSDSKDFERQTKIMREIEKDYGLTEVENPGLGYERGVSITRNESLKYERDGSKTPRLFIAEVVSDVVSQKPSLQQFIDTLASSGIDVRLSFKKDHPDIISGISFGYEGQSYTGSGIGRGFSFPSLVKKGLQHEIVQKSEIKKNEKKIATSFADFGFSEKLNNDDFFIVCASVTVSHYPVLSEDDWKKIGYYAESFEAGPPSIYQDKYVKMTDYGDRLSFSHDSNSVGSGSRAVAGAMMKGWTDVEVTGSQEFIRSVFQAAKDQGFVGVINGVQFGMSPCFELE